MIDTNRKFNTIFITISVIMILAICYMAFLIVRTENSRIYFDISEIENINWYNKDKKIEFSIDGTKATLIIGGEYLINEEDFTINEQTGEFIINGQNAGNLYLRSVGESNIVIWYEKAEYRLDREVINR